MPALLALARKVGQLLLVLLGVSLLTFVLLNRLPGDPALAVLGQDADPGALAAFRAEHDLERPLLVRYLDWASGAVVGDFGESYRTGNDVLESIWERVPISLEMVVLAQGMALLIAVPTAVLAAWRRGRLTDRIVNLVAFASLSTPSFLLAYVAILLFAVTFGWFPATGFSRISDGLGENLRTAFLPALTLAVGQFGVYVRVLRSDLIDTLRRDYITTAHGKGLATRRVLLRHVLRGSLLSLVTVVGLNVGVLLGGAVITEQIFAIPGVGRLLLEAIAQRDLMVVQGVVLFAAVSYVLLNTLVDACYSLLDPRIRSGGPGG